jgi:hypothetical protein
MSAVKIIPVNKVYKLTIGNPLSYSLASRNHPRFPLMWFDEDKNQNRALRYAINQKSPFEDEQDGNAIIEPIMFEDGLLVVPRENPVLQAFLHYHPLNGRVFVEVDKEKDAVGEVQDLDLEIDALVEARKLSLEQLEILTRVMFGKDPSTISTSELKRDILVFAKNDPKSFLATLNDPELQFQAKVRLFFEEKLLALRNNDKEIWFNTPTNRKKMVSVPFGEDPYDIAGYFLTSDDGLDALKMLEASLQK